MPVSDIRAYLSRLTPLVLRTDTLVTNHGYVDGGADAFPSVLQAGTAVLVDDYGVPAVRCYCGNPLTAAPDLGPGTTYTGTEWKGWKPERTVRVRPSDGVIDNFEVVDPATDSLFTRPAGTAGAADVATGEPAPAGYRRRGRRARSVVRLDRQRAAVRQHRDQCAVVRQPDTRLWRTSAW